MDPTFGARRIPGKLVAGIAVLFFAAVTGWLIGQRTFFVLPVVAGMAIFVVLLIGPRVSRLFVLALGLLLVGYALLDRGFAYLGLHPVYIGEIVLALAVMTILFAPRTRPQLNWITLALATFMGWGFARLLTDVGQYGIVAVRDSVIWLYGLFAIAVGVSLHEDNLRRLIRVYSKLVVPFLIIAPAAVILVRIAADSIPRWPGSGVPILHYKGGDLAVHLSGIGALILFGLYRDHTRAGAMSETRLWILWGLGASVSLTGRAALLTITLAVLLTFIVCNIIPSPKPRPDANPESRDKSHISRGQTVVFSAVMIFMAILFLILDPNISLGSRSVSVDQVRQNILSLLNNDSTDSGLQGSKRWRQEWWNKIYNYTVHGPYFWTGKGFGINLANDDGFQVSAGESLRSPHNGHMTILARMGVPGFVLWTVLQLSFGLSLLSALIRSARRKDRFWAQVNAWILVYWVAFLINATFDVYLEGPQGGIWFWSLFGAGIAALQMQAASNRQARESTALAWQERTRLASRAHP